MDLSFLVCLFICFPFWLSFVAWHFMLSSFSLSQSGIPNNDGPFSCSTKKLHQCLRPLIIMVTVHIPLCHLHELLYVHNNVFYRPIQLSDTCAEKSILYILKEIRLPLPPVSMCYSHISISWLPFGFSFAIITDPMLWRLKTFDLIASIFCSHLCFISVFGACHELLCAFLCNYLLTSFCSGSWILVWNNWLLHIAKLLLYAGHICGSCLVPQDLLLFCGSFVFLCVLSVTLLCWSCLFTVSNSFLSFLSLILLSRLFVTWHF